ncbi:Fc.00g018950.m01.CDS01 [Cosmosporella sp. VM-42]
MQRPNFISKRKLKSIPGSRKIQDDLGYSDPKRRRTEFSNTVKGYADTYTTDLGLAGWRLNKWTDENHQRGLSEMTSSFLDREGKFYWPDDETSLNYNGLQYSKDSRRFNDSRKRNKSKLGSTRSERGSSAEDPIEIDGLPDIATSPDEPEPQDAASDVDPATHRVTTPDASQDLAAFAQHEWEGHFNVSYGEGSTQNRNPEIDDPYAVPPSPPGSASTKSKGKRPAGPIQNGDAQRSKRSKRSAAHRKNVSTGSGHSAEDYDPWAGYEFPTAVDDPDGDEYVPTGAEELIESVEFDTPRQSAQMAPMASMGPPPVPARPISRQDTTETVRRQADDVPSTVPLFRRGLSECTAPPRNEDASLRLSESSSPFRTQEPSPPHDTPRCPGTETAQQLKAVHLPEGGHRRGIKPNSPPSLFREREPALYNYLEPAFGREQPHQVKPVLPSEIVPEPVFQPEVEPEPGLQQEIVPEPRLSIPQSSLNPKPENKIIFSVRISRRCCKTYDLKDAYEQKSLQEFVDQLVNKASLKKDFDGLSLVLETPERDIEDDVPLGNEVAFDEVRDRFQRKMDSCGSHDKRFEISIEPVRGGNPIF